MAAPQPPGHVCSHGSPGTLTSSSWLTITEGLSVAGPNAWSPLPLGLPDPSPHLGLSSKALCPEKSPGPPSGSPTCLAALPAMLPPGFPGLLVDVQPALCIASSRERSDFSSTVPPAPVHGEDSVNVVQGCWRTMTHMHAYRWPPTAAPRESMCGGPSAPNEERFPRRVCEGGMWWSWPGQTASQALRLCPRAPFILTAPPQPCLQTFLSWPLHSHGPKASLLLPGSNCFYCPIPGLQIPGSLGVLITLRVDW